MSSVVTRRMLPVALLTAVAAGALAIAPSPARADSPVATGWWNEARQSTAAVGQLPDDPTYTDDGSLVIRNTPAGAAAYAALRFVDRQADGGTVTLKISTSNTVEDPALVVCPTAASWSGGGDQQWDHAPGFDCTKTKISGDIKNGTVTFTIGKQLETLPGTFDFALLPDPGYTTPFDLTIAAPGSDSFQPTGGGSGYSGIAAPPADSYSGSGTSGSGAGAPASVDSAPPPADSSSTFSAPPANSGPAPAVAGNETQQAPQQQAAAPVLAGRQVAQQSGSSDNGRLLGIGLICAMGLLIMFLMANPGVASPRRLLSPAVAAAAGGAQGAHAAAPEPGAAPARLGGVGRFVRSRSGPPKRL